MNSFKSRINGQGKEVLEYTRLYGREKARQKYDVSVIAFDRWLQDETNDPNFGLHPIFTGDSPADLADNLLSAMLRKISTLESEKQKLVDLNHHLQIEIEYYKGQQIQALEPKILEVMKACEG